MTRWKWVLLGGPLGMLGLLNFAFGVDSASLSGLTSANEIGDFRVCANTPETDLAGKPCDLFCTSRRQFAIQSNTVAGERDVVVGVGETRRDACPTLCRRGLGALFCTCDVNDQHSDSQVEITPWEKICDLFCVEKRPESRKGEGHSASNEESKELHVFIRSLRVTGSSMKDAEVVLGSRGVPTKNDADGERRDADFFDLGRRSGGVRWTSKTRRSEDAPDLDWEEFCRIECARGNGGLACNCDVIP